MLGNKKLYGLTQRFFTLFLALVLLSSCVAPIFATSPDLHYQPLDENLETKPPPEESSGEIIEETTHEGTTEELTHRLFIAQNLDFEIVDVDETKEYIVDENENYLVTEYEAMQEVVLGVLIDEEHEIAEILVEKMSENGLDSSIDYTYDEDNNFLTLIMPESDVYISATFKEKVQTIPEITEEPTVVPSAPETELEVNEEESEEHSEPTEEEVGETDETDDPFKDVINEEPEFEEVPEGMDAEEYEAPTEFLNVAKLPEWLQTVVSYVQRKFSFRKTAIAPVTESNLTKNEFLQTSKTVHYDESLDELFLRLEVFLTGENRVEKRIPSDIVMVIDQSGSMDYCFVCGDDNADSIKLTANYQGVIIGSMKEQYRYFCWNKDNTKIIEVYYCDNGDLCKYVDANGNKVSHTPRWGTSDHRVKTTVSGTYYMPGPTNSPNLTSKIFYKTAEANEPWYTVVNEDGDPCFGKFSSKGTYNYTTTKSNKLYWCDYHGAWFTKQTCNSSNHTATYLRYPKCNSSDNNYRSTAFYSYNLNHPVYSAKLDKTETYQVSHDGRGVGMPYTEVAWCAECQAWHVKEQHNSPHYTPKKSSSASGYTFYGECKQSRIDVLNQSLGLFLNTIYEDSIGKDKEFGTADDVHNRISIVGFGATDTSANVIHSYAAEGDMEATSKTYVELYTGEDLDLAATPMGGEPTVEIFQNSLQDVSTERGQSVINSAVDHLVFGSNTEVFKGMRMADDIYNLNLLDPEEERNRIVVLFTDGEPLSSLDPGDDKYSDSTSYRFCDAALNYAYHMKQNDTIIYTIGIFSGADASNMLTTVGKAPRNNSNKFMHLVSSNFPNAIDSDIAYSANDVNPDLQANESYYLSTSTTSGLNEIFSAIATNILGNAAHIKTMGGPSLIQDVMSANFSLKYGADKGKIRVHTEAYQGFVDGKRAWLYDNNQLVDSTLAIEIDENSQQVKVSGFNYTENYVATDTKADGTISHRGRRVIIEIPIDATDVNFGGNMMQTNGSPSAVYDENGNLVEEFNSPYIDMPTNIDINHIAEGKSPDYNQIIQFKVEYEKFGGYEEIYWDVNNENNYLSTSETIQETTGFGLAHNNFMTLEGVQCGTVMKISPTNVPENYNLYYYLKNPDGTTSERVFVETETVEIEVVAGTQICFISEKKTVQVEIYKTDYEGINHLKGAKMQILDIDGNIIEEFDTNGEAYITKLPYGEYVLKEIEAPDGYHKMWDDKIFKVDPDDEVIIVETMNVQIVMMVSTGGHGYSKFYILPISLGVICGVICLYIVFGLKSEDEKEKVE